MLRIPAITALEAVREGSLVALQRDIATAHDALPQVIEAMRYMPQHVLRHPRGVKGGQCRVCLRDGVLESKKAGQPVPMIRDW